MILHLTGAFLRTAGISLSRLLGLPDNPIVRLKSLQRSVGESSSYLLSKQFAAAVPTDGASLPNDGALDSQSPSQEHAKKVKRSRAHTSTTSPRGAIVGAGLGLAHPGGGGAHDLEASLLGQDQIDGGEPALETL